jgi:membrane associated rhomboid family serine protease
MLESGHCSHQGDPSLIPFRDDNPTRSFPFVVVALIAANVVIFIHQLSLPRPEQLYFNCTYGAVPAVLLGQATVEDSIRHVLAQLLRPDLVNRFLLQYPVRTTALDPIWLTVFTSMFLHGGILHLGMNMLYLWIFGNNIEDALGHFRFIVFYLVCGVIAAGAQILLNLGSLVPMIGASGAIAGVLGAYYVKFPHARVHSLVFLFFFVTVIALPAGLVLLLWLLYQIWYSLQPAGPGGIAVFAHIGGFLAGLVLVKRFEPRRRRFRLTQW